MNYRESKLILEEIKKAKKILLNCHRSPDPDAIGCSLAMYAVLARMGKEAKIICPSKELFENLSYLRNYERIKKGVDFSSFDFSRFDIFVIMDSSNWEIVSGVKNFEGPKIKTIVIDHHPMNTSFGDINLIDAEVTSTAEILYLVFKDWRVSIDKDIANSLLAGIIGDTGVFRNLNSDQRTLAIASDLIDKGADKDQLVYNLYMSEPFSLIKFYGEVLDRMELDRKNRFVWAAIPYRVYRKFGLPANAKKSVANMFAQVVKETDFGFIILEYEPKKISVSFRSRTGFDTSRIARELGGGGHIYASAAELQGIAFETAVGKILHVARKFHKSPGK